MPSPPVAALPCSRPLRPCPAPAPAEPRRPTELHCPTCTATVATAASAATAATAATTAAAAMASPCEDLGSMLGDALAAAGIMASIHEQIEPAAEPELVDAGVGADEDSGGGLPSPPTEGWGRRQQRQRDAREPTWQRTWLW
ncbi:unnamed protein product [Closterium sp. NIES-54]